MVQPIRRQAGSGALAGDPVGRRVGPVRPAAPVASPVASPGVAPVSAFSRLAESLESVSPALQRYANARQIVNNREDTATAEADAVANQYTNLLEARGFIPEGASTTYERAYMAAAGLRLGTKRSEDLAAEYSTSFNPDTDDFDAWLGERLQGDLQGFDDEDARRGYLQALRVGEQALRRGHTDRVAKQAVENRAQAGFDFVRSAVTLARQSGEGLGLVTLASMEDGLRKLGFSNAEVNDIAVNGLIQAAMNEQDETILDVILQKGVNGLGGTGLTQKYGKTVQDSRRVIQNLREAAEAEKFAIERAQLLTSLEQEYMRGGAGIEERIWSLVQDTDNPGGWLSADAARSVLSQWDNARTAQWKADQAAAHTRAFEAMSLQLVLDPTSITEEMVLGSGLDDGAKTSLLTRLASLGDEYRADAVHKQEQLFRRLGEQNPAAYLRMHDMLVEKTANPNFGINVETLQTIRTRAEQRMAGGADLATQQAFLQTALTGSTLAVNSNFSQMSSEARQEAIDAALNDIPGEPEQFQQWLQDASKVIAATGKVPSALSLRNVEGLLAQPKQFLMVQRVVSQLSADPAVARILEGQMGDASELYRGASEALQADPEGNPNVILKTYMESQRDGAQERMQALLSTKDYKNKVDSIASSLTRDRTWFGWWGGRTNGLDVAANLDREAKRLMSRGNFTDPFKALEQAKASLLNRSVVLTNRLLVVPAEARLNSEQSEAFENAALLAVRQDHPDVSLEGAYIDWHEGRQEYIVKDQYGTPFTRPRSGKGYSFNPYRGSNETGSVRNVIDIYNKAKLDGTLPERWKLTAEEQ